MTDLSIITVTWNSKTLIGQQIESVQSGCARYTCEEIVVDNGSPDGTADFVRRTYGSVTVIANTKNNGFGAANNQGVAVAKGEWLLFLNPDMRILPGSLDMMIDWMRAHPEVGIASVKLVDENGNINRDAMPRRFPKVWEQVALILKIPHVFPHLLDQYHMVDLDPNKEQEVDSVRGSFFLVRRELIQKIGFAFDPRYFIWYEEVDACREARRLGYEVVYTPIISAVDYVGQSFKQRTTLWKQKQFTRSMLTYFQKWEPWYKWVWIALFRPIGIMLAWLNDFFQKRNRKKFNT